MSLRTLRICRLSIGITAAVAFAYGSGWPLAYLLPILTVLFLARTAWMGLNGALIVLALLAVALLIGVLISNFLLQFPLFCLPFYMLLFFLIYYHGAAASTPMIPIFMTLGVTMIPIVSFSGVMVSHLVAFLLLWYMALALLFAWLFHSLLPDTLVKESEEVTMVTPPPKAVITNEQERGRLALTSTIVASTAVIVFFALNLTDYALAMLFICIMAGNPNQNASLQFMKANTISAFIGGVAVIVAYNLLVAVPTYPFLIALVLLFSLLFSTRIYSDSPWAPAFQSGFTTFLILLGSSTSTTDSATVDFYLRIGQILFAGVFTVLSLTVVEHLLRPRSKTMRTNLAR